MKQYVTQASIQFNQELLIKFKWISDDKPYYKLQLRELCEVIPKESISKADSVVVDETSNQISITSGIKIELGITASIYSIYETYYPSICKFFRIDESYESKIWQQILEKTEDNSKVEVVLVMNDKEDGRFYDLQVIRYRADNVFKSYNHKKYPIA